MWNRGKRKQLVGVDDIYDELGKAISRNFDRRVVNCLVCGVAIIAVALCMDIYIIGTSRSSKSDSLDDFFDIIITLDTILAAVVIFFYGVQDSRKEGIPHRTIMAYSFGSLSVPVLFMYIMILLPVIFWAVSTDFRWTAWTGLGYTYVSQMIIIILILLSTSSQYSVHVIGNVEIRQFQRLNDLEEKRYQIINNDGERVARNPRFVWTYLLHHLEQVLLSEEMIADKQGLIRRLVRAPYYYSEIRFREEFYLVKGTGTGNMPCISGERLGLNHMKSVYEFYYLNFLEVFRHINKPEDQEERNKIYLMLYEFMEELTELYERANRDRYAGVQFVEHSRNNYLMTISGILNAVVESDVENAESACYYVLNNIVSRKIRRFQIGLFFLFQEFLYHTNINSVSLREIDKLDELEKWCCFEEERGMYAEFWEIWVEFATLSKLAGYEYFDRAFEGLKGESYNPGPATYINLIIERTKEDYINASKNYYIGE